MHAVRETGALNTQVFLFCLCVCVCVCVCVRGGGSLRYMYIFFIYYCKYCNTYRTVWTANRPRAWVGLRTLKKKK